jgi:hypothetical protein
MGRAPGNGCTLNAPHCAKALRLCSAFLPIALGLAACRPGSFPATTVSADGTGGGSTTGLPCAVASTLASQCQGCHASAPILGAPMALATWEDLQRPAITDPSRPVWQLVSDRVHDQNRPMPPGPFPPLAGDALAGLDDWIAAGAPRSDEVCQPGETVTPPDPDLEAMTDLPCQPTEKYVAHAPFALDGGYPIPGPSDSGGDVTVCFRFVRPASSSDQAIAWRPVLDDKRALHHMNLYATTEPVENGTIGPCRYDNATYLMGWEPGRPNTVLPTDVGLQLPATGSRGLILEVHYHNAAGASAEDRSGMEICTADTPRPYTAGVLTTGTQNIVVPARGESTATGTCPSSLTMGLSEPLHVLASAPHMHNIGRSLETTVVHADGTTDTLTPAAAWDPHRQPLYKHDPVIDIRPGDTVTTLCRFNNPSNDTVRFGARAVDEMCYAFNIVYPLSALPQGLADSSLRLCDCPQGGCAP